MICNQYSFFYCMSAIFVCISDIVRVLLIQATIQCNKWYQYYVMNYSINSFTGASEANLLVQGILFCISETILKTSRKHFGDMVHGTRCSPPWSGRCRPGRAAGMTPTSKNDFFNGFSLYLGLKMNIFQKMKHESYSTFKELSNAFYRFLKFEFHQELWAKNNEILTLKSGFSFFLVPK